MWLAFAAGKSGAILVSVRHLVGAVLFCFSSASGKTTVAEKIIEKLEIPWVTILSMDSFYKVVQHFCLARTNGQLPTLGSKWGRAHPSWTVELQFRPPKCIRLRSSARGFHVCFLLFSWRRVATSRFRSSRDCAREKTARFLFTTLRLILGITTQRSIRCLDFVYYEMFQRSSKTTNHNCYG